MMTHEINIFISHSWDYPEHYDKLHEWIFDSHWNSIKFNNTSIPKDDPIHFAPTQDKLRQAIFAEIAKSHIVIIPTGMYATHSKWIKEEIKGANQHQRPILAVNPWGQEKKSQEVIKHAESLVNWTEESVVNEIWKLYAKHYK